jgi:hypothetical protein
MIPSNEKSQLAKERLYSEERRKRVRNHKRGAGQLTIMEKQKGKSEKQTGGRGEAEDTSGKPDSPCDRWAIPMAG